jgi:hypothetical protein
MLFITQEFLILTQDNLFTFSLIAYDVAIIAPKIIDF